MLSKLNTALDTKIFDKKNWKLHQKIKVESLSLLQEQSATCKWTSNWIIWLQNDPITIQKVQLTNVQNTFQENLKEDIQNIKSSTKMLVFADKSTNFYDLSRDHYEKLLHGNITQTYKKAGPQAKKNINKESKKFVKSLNLVEKMEC